MTPPSSVVMYIHASSTSLVGRKFNSAYTMNKSQYQAKILKATNHT